MSEDYSVLSESEKLHYWESIISHKIRSQAESTDDSLAWFNKAVYNVFCLQDPDFSRFIPQLRKKFISFAEKAEKFANDHEITDKKTAYDYIKNIIVYGAIFVYLCAQVFFIIKGGWNGFIFVLVLNTVMGVPYGLGVYNDSKSKKLYHELANEKGLRFSFSKSGLPGFLYWPKVDGEYKGFKTRLSLTQRWTGRMQGGQFQIRTGTVLCFELPKALTPVQQENYLQSLQKKVTNNKATITVKPNEITYQVAWTLSSKEKKDEMAVMYDLLVEGINKIK